jgi:hypothetical protein
VLYRLLYGPPCGRHFLPAFARNASARARPADAACVTDVRAASFVPVEIERQLEQRIPARCSASAVAFVHRSAQRIGVPLFSVQKVTVGNRALEWDSDRKGLNRPETRMFIGLVLHVESLRRARNDAGFRPIRKRAASI